MEVRNRQQNIGFGILSVRFDYDQIMSKMAASGDTRNLREVCTAHNNEIRSAFENGDYCSRVSVAAGRKIASLISGATEQLEESLTKLLENLGATVKKIKTGDTRAEDEVIAENTRWVARACNGEEEAIPKNAQPETQIWN